jgi:hypothetical protein
MDEGIDKANTSSLSLEADLLFLFKFSKCGDIGVKR